MEGTYKKEHILIFILAILILSLFLKKFPENYRLFIFIISCLISFNNVYSFIFLLVASILIPDNGFYSFTATQIATILFVSISFIRYKKIYVFSPKHIHYFVLFIIWLLFTSILNKDGFILKEVLKGFIIGFIFYNSISLSNLNNFKAVYYKLLGLAIIIPIIFSNILKIDIFYSENMRSPLFVGYEGIRFAGIKQDPNALAVIINLIIWGFFNLVMKENKPKILKIILYLLIILSGLYILIYTQSRGGYILFVFGALITLIFQFIQTKKGIIRNKKKLYFILAAVLIGGTIIVIKNHYIISLVLKNLYEKKLDYRSANYKDALAIIIDNPYFGYGFEKYVFKENFGYPHNTFLDVGVASGLVGILLFFIITLIPILIYFKNNLIKNISGSIVLIFYLLILLAMQSLSMHGDKLFWINWFWLLKISENNG